MRIGCTENGDQTRRTLSSHGSVWPLAQLSCEPCSSRRPILLVTFQLSDHALNVFAIQLFRATEVILERLLHASHPGWVMGLSNSEIRVQSAPEDPNHGAMLRAAQPLRGWWGVAAQQKGWKGGVALISAIPRIEPIKTSTIQSPKKQKLAPLIPRPTFPSRVRHAKSELEPNPRTNGKKIRQAQYVLPLSET